VTFARLWFARDSVVVRYAWNNGKLWGASNTGSFPGTHTEVERIPSPMPLVRHPSGLFAVANLVTGTTRFFRVHRDAAGRAVSLELVGAQPVAIARRTQ
jgi:hypothetical protein